MTVHGSRRRLCEPTWESSDAKGESPFKRSPWIRSPAAWACRWRRPFAAPCGSWGSCKSRVHVEKCRARRNAAVYKEFNATQGSHASSSALQACLKKFEATDMQSGSGSLVQGHDRRRSSLLHPGGQIGALKGAVIGLGALGVGLQDHQRRPLAACSRRQELSVSLSSVAAARATALPPAPAVVGLCRGGAQPRQRQDARVSLSDR
jgi:hypothetical protein